MTVIPVLEDVEDQKFEVTLKYVTILEYVRPCVKRKRGRKGGGERK